LPEKLTDSYAASLKQQAVPLFQGVACCKLPANTPDRTRSFFACRAYGLLCRIPETAISSAGFWAWRLANYMQTLQIIQKAVTHQARSFSCLQSLRTLMPHPRNSNQIRWFLGVASGKLPANTPDHPKSSNTPSKVFFLLAELTGSYAASQKQQSLPLVSGVASSKFHPPSIRQKTIRK
jgi:hypothetical protein